MAEQVKNLASDSQYQYGESTVRSYSAFPQSVPSPEEPQVRIGQFHNRKLPNEAVTKSQHNFTLLERIALSLCAILCLYLLLNILTMRLNITQMRTEISQISSENSYYQTQINELNGSIKDQYNYKEIRQAAISEGMFIDKERVRTVIK